MNGKPVIIISDIHANEIALRAVLQSIDERFGKQAVIRCLGDVVGYGARPWECIELVKARAEFTILGNHDQAALFDPAHFSDGAWESIVWTRNRLETIGRRVRQDPFEFFSELPGRMVVDGVLYVHGSPYRPLDEYVKPDVVFNEKQLARIEAALPDLGFNGHTHLPGVLRFGPSPEFIPAATISGEFALEPGVKSLVNAGSVGQPRDGNKAACYLAYYPDRRAVEYCRVSYDVEAAAAQVFAEEGENGLRRAYGERLKVGR